MTMYLLDDKLDRVGAFSVEPERVSSPLPLRPSSPEPEVGDWLSGVVDVSSRAVSKYLNEPLAAISETAGAVISGALAGLPVSGLGELSELGRQAVTGEELDLERAQQVGERAARAVTYAPRTPLGQWLTGKVGWLLEQPAKGVRWFGGKLVDWGVPPAVAAGITTPAEFLLYAYLFKLAHGVLPKGAKEAGIKASDLAGAKELIERRVVSDELVNSAREAVRRQEAISPEPKPVPEKAAPEGIAPPVVPVERFKEAKPSEPSKPLTPDERSALRKIGYKGKAFKTIDPDKLREAYRNVTGRDISEGVVRKPNRRPCLKPSQPPNPKSNLRLLNLPTSFAKESSLARHVRSWLKNSTALCPKKHSVVLATSWLRKGSFLKLVLASHTARLKLVWLRSQAV